jgi:integrase
MGRLKEKGLKALVERPGRYADGDGLYFKTIGQGRAYWTYRFTIGGREHEKSLGPFPETTLDEARIKHAELRAQVLKGVDPVASMRAAKTGKPIPLRGVPTFGQMADQYVEAHEAEWKNRKHARQWRMTLTVHAAAIRSTPVDRVDTDAVLSVLKSIWTKTPETASRLRARIEIVLASAAVAGHIPKDRPNPARWEKWLALMLPNPKKVGPPRGEHAALPYEDVPALMARLAEVNTTAARALRFTILTCARSDETFGTPWDEIDFDNALWTIPAERMKMEREHMVPLSDAALDILREMRTARRNDHPYVFPGERPRRPLSHMGMSLVLKRMGIDATTHGFRTSFRTWCSEKARVGPEKARVEFDIAEHCLAHKVGNKASQSYNRTTLLDLRRPVLAAWADYVCPASNLTGKTTSNVEASAPEEVMA